MPGLDRDALRQAIKTAGLTARELSLSISQNEYLVRDILNGKSQNPRMDTIRKIADALGAPVEQLFSTSQSGALNAVKGYGFNILPTVGIPVIGEVEAGVFRLALEIPEEERTVLPIVELAGYDGLRQVALKVTGPSMNLVYPDGSYVIVIPAGETDVRHGDRVVVYTTEGAACEATIKEVQVEPDGRIALWPRSSHPAHQAPIYLERADQDSPQIAYVVIGTFREENRPPPTIAVKRRA